MSLTVAPTWERRFRLPRQTLPVWAKQRPERCVFVSDLTGVTQVYCWDVERRSLRRVTDRPGGTRHCAIPSSGRSAWWFADTEGDECGLWLSQPFDGGPVTEVAPGLQPAWMSGLVLGLGDHALLGRSTEDGSEILLVRPDGSARPVHRHPEPAAPVDMTRDLALIAVEHNEDGDLWSTATRVLTVAGDLVRDVPPDDGGRLDAIGFAPVPGDRRLLLMRTEGDLRVPSILDPVTGERTDVRTGLTGELDAAWWADGSGLLLLHGREARSELHRWDFRSATLTRIAVPPGTVQDASSRPDGSVWYLWSDAATPPRFASTGAQPGLVLSDAAPPRSVPVTAVWVDGPAGPVHTLVSRPADARGPVPTVMLLHGGPEDQDLDEFSPEVAAWVDHGFAVLRPNYRGSSGYGTAWTEAIRQRVGFVELEDVDAVRRWAVERRVADPDRMVLAGSSWGGYLTLLGLGTQPGAWAVGLADAPVADPAAAYEDEMEEVRALDRTLFGGSPADAMDRYRAASPLTYLPSVRAPVLISAGARDPRCPPRQVEMYVAGLAELGRVHEVHRHGSGHTAAAVEDRIGLFRRQLAFATAHLPARAPLRAG